MDETRQPDDVDDETSQYLEGLVRNHLRAVSYRDATPPLTPHMDHLTRPFVLEVLINGLEQDRDIVLARLLRAAVRVEQVALGEEAGVVDGFLQRSVDYIMGVELVTRKDCRFSRDRLLAAHVLLDGHRTTWSATDGAAARGRGMRLGLAKCQGLRPGSRTIPSDSIANSFASQGPE